MMLETRRRVLTLAQVQCPPIIIATVEYDLHGALANGMVIGSGLIFLTAVLTMTWDIRFIRCANCGERYFGSRLGALAFYISRRCAHCSIKDGEPAGSYWGGR
jgi:hypothetical protein